MKRYILIFVLVFSSTLSFSQGFRFSVYNSNIRFTEFGDKPIMFNGLGGDLTVLLNRIGMNVCFNYYFPKEYYGMIRFYDLGSIRDKTTYVNARGGAYSLGLGLTLDFIRTKSDRFRMAANLGIHGFGHKGKYDKDPMVRIYGGADDISVGYAGYRFGIASYFKIRRFPLTVFINRCHRFGTSEYDSFDYSEYYELGAGVVFPILLSPAPSEIKKIVY